MIQPKYSNVNQRRTADLQPQSTVEHRLARKARQLAIMKILHHPNLLNLNAVFESRTHIACLFDEVDNEDKDLFSYVEQKRFLDNNEAFRIFRQIIFVLQHLHRHLIYHRDIRLESLLINTRTGHVRLMFNSFITHAPLGEMLETSCGSPHYCSAEIATVFLL
jgi:serine/threonine protein kinase